MPTEGLTEVQETQLVELLSLMGARMSAAVYNAIAAKTALTAIETVILRETGGDPQILLTQRPPEDVHYAGQWHSPGSMLRASDAPDKFDTPIDFVHPFDRVGKEIGVPIEVVEFADYVFQRTPRGVENGLVFICRATGEPTKGTWFPADALPEPLIEHHRPIIKAALEARWPPQ